MPLVVEGPQGPLTWAGANPASQNRLIRHNAGGAYVEVALINSMPDSALGDTEDQFFHLLDSATAENLLVRLRLFCLPGVPRGDSGRERVRRNYCSFEDLFNYRCDALIMTGTEPHQDDLRQEPYWNALVQALEWADRNCASAVLSCLAAHAGVLHFDGIRRHLLGDKRCGVFAFPRVGHYILTEQAGDVLRFPHSRWNEVGANDLSSCGYEILTHSAEAGVDLFVKKRSECLFVHFQGHPEYDAVTLLKEYRRDVRRFLKGEREKYPTMPSGYFDRGITEAFTCFRSRALANPSEELMTQFPYARAAKASENTWRLSAACVYRNWLQYVVARKTDHLAVVAKGRVGHARSASASD